MNVHAKYSRTMDPAPTIENSHLIAELIGDAEGPTLMAFGSVHGNEAAGSAALERVAEALSTGGYELRGRVYLFRGNTRALAVGTRFIEFDLNRHWTGPNVVRNLPDTAIQPQLSEDREQAELLRDINHILASAHDEVYAIDLHSTSAEGVPFATVGDTMRNRAFAQKFPVTVLLGIEEQLEGTLLEYLNNLGVVTLGYEGGQHYSESTVAVHEALTWRAMVNAGIIPEAEHLKRFDRILLNATRQPKIFEVRYRHAIKPDDEFRMLPGFNNFDPIDRGRHIANDKKGMVVASEKGVILMPLYQKLGEDGFFIGRGISPFWISLSGVLRRLRIGGMMYLLPGVRRSGKDRDTLEVDTRIARFFPLQLFHLLGFRKLRWRESKLLVSRRKHDISGPFGAG
jgi:predicted deacylase